MTPIFTFDDFFSTAGLTARDAITSAFGLTAVLLAFLYFALGWATNRVKDHDPRQLAASGCAALVAWTSAAGSVGVTIIGTNFFALLYFAFHRAVYWWHLVPFVTMLAISIYFWVCLVRLFMVHVRHRGEFARLGKRMLDQIHDYRRGFWIVVLSIIVLGWFSFFEAIIGDAVAAIMGVCFCLIAVMGLGTYMSLRGDLLPRTCTDDE